MSVWIVDWSIDGFGEIQDIDFPMVRVNNDPYWQAVARESQLTTELKKSEDQVKKLELLRLRLVKQKEQKEGNHEGIMCVMQCLR